jgi:hypothetical protein
MVFPLRLAKDRLPEQIMFLHGRLLAYEPTQSEFR